MHPPPSAAGAWAARVDAHGAALEDGASGAYLRLDPRGRWLACRRRDGWLRRTLLGEPRDGARPQAALDAAACRAAEAAVRAEARAWHARVQHEGAPLAPRDRRRLLRLLALAAAPAPERLAGWARRAREAYPEGVPILPPHRARDVVVTPARGCPNAGCTFCVFHRGQRFEPLPGPAYAQHLERVARLHGPGLAARTGLFLGSASAASLPDATLLSALDAARERLGPLRRGAAAFLDPDHAPAREAGRWARLRAHGLRDVTLGLETGLAPLRRAVGKSERLDRFARTVHALVEGGLDVALTVLLGLGGPAQQDAHRDATVRLIATLPLAPTHIVYLSALDAATPRADDAATADWRAALSAVTRARVAPYPATTFVAWA